MEAMTKPPVFDIDMDAFWHDPYPALAALRDTAPVAFVPQLDGIVMTRRDDIDLWENASMFSVRNSPVV